MRWLLRQFHLCPNAYYNYKKHRKEEYQKHKQEVLDKITEIYHKNNGVDGYRRMTVYLDREGYSYCPGTIHQYMNKILGLRSIVRPKRPEGSTGKPHKVFSNLLNQQFSADAPNQKWCTDFTYLFLENGDVRYNCATIDLYDRSVVSSVTGPNITSELAIRTLEKALDTQPGRARNVMLHSDQGSQFTSKAFIDFCARNDVAQSMSRAGYPYDNAPMERYFNTLKNECTNLYTFATEEMLCQTVQDFAYVTYNHVRPHSYNDNRTPIEARYAKELKTRHTAPLVPFAGPSRRAGCTTQGVLRSRLALDGLEGRATMGLATALPILHSLCPRRRQGDFSTAFAASQGTPGRFAPIHWSRWQHHLHAPGTTHSRPFMTLLVSRF